MPTTAAGPAIIMLWHGFRLQSRVDRAVAQFDGGAAFVLPDEHALAQFNEDFRSSNFRYSIYLGGLIALVIAGVEIYVFPRFFLSQQRELLVILGTVMLTAGYVMGYLLGRIFGYGRLEVLLARHRITFASLSTPPAQDAVTGDTATLDAWMTWAQDK